MVLERINKLTHLRRNHATWVVLVARRAPLILGCLETLFEEKSEIPFEDVIQHLGDIFEDFKNVDDFDIGSGDVYALARKEIREWLKRKLIVEREGMVLSTDALQRAFFFLLEIDEQEMTSTASRLHTVQGVIESLEVRLNPDRHSRSQFIKKKIAEYELQLERIESGEVEVLDEKDAVEGIKEVFQQSMSLKADFRRVEDSYREADRALRKKITRNDQNRSDVLDSLLQSHEDLLETAEGRVFGGFYQQLMEQVKLDEMKQRLRFILDLKVADEALNRKQKNDLRYLVSSLVDESQRVIEARSKGEQDVKSYVKTGLASENYRVGIVLNNLLDRAGDIDWEQNKICRRNAQLPPLGFPVTNLPVIQRMLCKEIGSDDDSQIDLTVQNADSVEYGEDFWASFESLDREDLYSQTYQLLEAIGKPVPISQLKKICPVEHDLEALSYWLTMAREAGIRFSDEREKVIVSGDNEAFEFTIPLVKIGLEDLKKVDRDNLG